jgi:muramoyltetrapeptide carboxypeptidase
MGKIKCRPLTPGARIGVVAPASPVSSAEQIDAALQLLRDQGFEVVAGTCVRQGDGFLAGSNLERRLDLERMLTDPYVAAIWCLRGGYGCLRLLSSLYWPLFARYPKPLIGFSDISALQLALWSQAKLVTFHGPVLTTLNRSPFITEQALQMLTGKADRVLPWPKDPDGQTVVPIKPGQATGIILGGNLATLVSLLGTRFMPELNGKILFIEEVTEEQYKVDRMLTQLILSGAVDEVAAVLVGRSVPVNEQTEADLITVFTERLAQLDCPSAYGFPIGHATYQWTIPQGINVEVDTQTGSVILLEEPFLIKNT